MQVSAAPVIRPCALMARILAAQFESFANHVGQLVQDFRQVSARTLLQQHGRNEEVHVQRGHALGQLLKRHIQRQAQVVLLEGSAELARQRLLEFALNHFQETEKACPARMERATNSRLSGNISSNRRMRAVRFLITYIRGSAPASSATR